MGPCMCGDTYCPSCGPAQGNYRCMICGRWSEDGGCEKPEECDRKGREMDDALAKDLIEEERLAAEWRASEGRN